jgi:heme o synthase
MSMTSVTLEDTRTVAPARVADYIELTKPRIATLVLVTVTVAMVIAAWGAPNAMLLFNTLIGTTFVAASASALNQWLEQETDRRMDRTADRPLPTGRLTSAQVMTFAIVTIVAGVLQLAVTVNWLTAALGFLTWFLYVWVYTPLKSRTSANTAVGAVAGALPVLMGWSAVAPLDMKAFALFLIVFLWQFPHFMAIAWIYRQQYAEAGLKMLPVVDPSGHRAGAQAVIAALLLVPVSLVPAVQSLAGPIFAGGMISLSMAQLVCAIWFCAKMDDVSARRLLRASLVYLPLAMILLMLGPLV